MTKHLRINSEIRVDKVRVIGSDGDQLGIISLADALAEAERQDLDLVEVAPNSSPPVCRIMDYGKHMYQQSKKTHGAKKSQSTVQLKEIRIRPKTEEHDLQVKLRHIQRFLEQNNKVKVTMMFRGREIVYADKGRQTMEEIKDKLGDICIVDQFPKREGRNMIMILSPPKK
ncbi:MAG: translation initiation factor IF-3 [Thermodesulfobacteriota bacterium]|nr:translation initiation factor IF-3 [Thermodesulfobacteriota bacterium]